MRLCKDENDVSTSNEGCRQAPLDDEYSSPDVHGYDDGPRASEGSVEVARADTTDVDRAGGSNDGSDDEASASDDSDIPGDSPPSRAGCLPVNSNSGAESTGHGATYASIEASEASDKLRDGDSVTKDGSEDDRDVVAVAETTTWDVLPTGIAASEVDWGEHDPGPNDVPTEAGTSTADADTEFHDSDVSAIDDPEQLLEATYISVMYAMVAEGSDEGDDTLNDVSEHVANRINLTENTLEYLPTPRLKPTTRIWPYMERARDDRRKKLLEMMIELPVRAIQLANASVSASADETKKDEAQGRVIEASDADINVEEVRARAPDLGLRRCMDLIMKRRYEWIWDSYDRHVSLVQGSVEPSDDTEPATAESSDAEKHAAEVRRAAVRSLDRLPDDVLFEFNTLQKMAVGPYDYRNAPGVCVAMRPQRRKVLETRSQVPVPYYQRQQERRWNKLASLTRIQLMAKSSKNVERTGPEH
ncbi:hypothetical protein PHYSODRAFT_325223 [Phytophthora sojae]|uniref:Uncharacterized protein n=1 Tax=Phytophthora sojae (strain P6497) TaxID=1094619 RepID=G4YRN0_PHYSP|nr:hypothetical protein PHYSODRAFT_325223 [Phytophthora sojae]EGZ24071.1 hypothetical protein PHYSODRAFT_325223 [Phytophthora sojae]|eukprot:XP_009519359.1 hypothetical protein PHYSODRAFT_325223 [Phytophthora sojae]